jgi:hypothetical protein
MAKLYPSLSLIEKLKVPPTSGELDLIKFLNTTLDDNYEVYYQPYLNGDNPDIVILREDAGVLIIEVKDWNLDHYSLDGKARWILKKDGTKIKSPFSQVRSYRNNMINLHIPDLLPKTVQYRKYYAVVNTTVFFSKTDVEDIAEILQPVYNNFNLKKAAKYNRFWGQDDLNEESLNLLLENIRLNKESLLFTKNMAEGLRRYLKPPIHKVEEGIKLRYTEEQKKLIESENGKKVKIKGVAGSGKTMVLAKRAVNAHLRTKENVLILTYNLALKNYVHDKINEVREEFDWDNFHINNYHQFFKQHANNHGIMIKGFSSWDDPKFFEHKKNRISKYRSIFIDEIQDYKTEWIELIINYFLAEDGELVVFGDEKQNIYKRPLDADKHPVIKGIPGQWNRSLKTVQRFSGDITKLAMEYQREILSKKYELDELNFVDQEFLSLDDNEIEHYSLDVINTDDVCELIMNLMKKKDIHPSDAAVLGSNVDILKDIDYVIRNKYKEKVTTTFETKEVWDYLIDKYEIKNPEELLCASDEVDWEKAMVDKSVFENEIYSIRRNKKFHFWMKTGVVKLSTIHSFKGWESPTLFLVLDETDDFTSPELVYAGLTRCRFRLIIINNQNNTLHNFFTKQIHLNN